jgi:hypothetical protein
MLDLSAYPDATISGMLVRTESMVDSYLGYSLNVEDVVDELVDGHIDINGDLLIFTQKRPILSVSSMSLVKGTDTISLTITDGSTAKYDIYNGSYIRYGNSELTTLGTSTLASLWELRNKQFYVRVSYRAGYETIPADILNAISGLAKSEVATNQNVGGAKRIRQGGIDIEYADGGYNELERDSYRVLDNYKRSTPF